MQKYIITICNYVIKCNPEECHCPKMRLQATRYNKCLTTGGSTFLRVCSAELCSEELNWLLDKHFKNYSGAECELLFDLPSSFSGRANRPF